MKTLTDTAKDNQVEKIVRKMLPASEGSYRKYSNLKAFTEGGTRKIFQADWGPAEKKVVIKVDKSPKTPNAKRHVSRGYTTERELQIAAGIKDAEENNILPLRDYYFSEDLKNLGYSGFITIEDYFPGETLETCIKKEGPLKKEDFRNIFKDILKAEAYLINKEGILHRDPNPKNILVKRNGRLKAVLTDLTNAGKKEDLEKKVLPTSGSRNLIDPMKFNKFSGEISSYDESSEIRALAVDMYFGATGKMPFKFDPDSGEAIELASGKSLLNQEGKIDIKKYQGSLKKTIRNLPKEMKRYSRLFEHGLSIDPKKRYQTIGEFSQEFDKLSKPTFWEKIKSKWRRNSIIGLTALTLLGGVIGSGISSNNKNKTLQEELEQAKSMYRVKSEWDGTNLEISNNLLETEIRLYKEGSLLKESYPDKKFLSASPGETFWGPISVREVPLPKNQFDGLMQTLEGKIYIEGYNGKEFMVQPGNYNRCYEYEMMAASIGYEYLTLKIPEEIKEGTYKIAIELYAPKEPAENFMGSKHLKFENPGKAIYRKTIPLIIATPSDSVQFNQLRLNTDFYNYLEFRRIDDEFERINPNLKYEVSVPGRKIDVGFNTGEFNSNVAGSSLNLPKGTGEKEMTIQAISRRKNGEIIHISYHPIEWKEITPEYGCWEHQLPDKGWSEKLVQYREEAYKTKN